MRIIAKANNGMVGQMNIRGLDEKSCLSVLRSTMLGAKLTKVMTSAKHGTDAMRAAWQSWQQQMVRVRVTCGSKNGPGFVRIFTCWRKPSKKTMAVMWEIVKNEFAHKRSLELPGGKKVRGKVFVEHEPWVALTTLPPVKMAGQGGL